ncbi:MAG: family 43 glycosylhydrolase [Caldilineaceae bacterium]|nr:family 43 glycosylhydrolase [Caldilineaceae bacterium]
MYHHPGEYVTDFCLVQRDGCYHLFHIRGERWTWPVGYKELDLGHATSTDLRTWTPHAPVLPAGPLGAWDECGNWAPDIIEVDGLYYCYYTGSDTNNNQAIGLATSTDLFHWEKHSQNPVVVPGPWSDQQIGRDVAGRDAMVFADQPRQRYLLYYTATMADGRACLALAQSTDLIHWEDRGPTYIEEDRSYNRLESAYLVEHDGRYYLFYSAKGGPKSKGFSPTAFAHFDIVYLVADEPTGGWRKPANHELLTEWTCASEHPTFDGTTYMLYIIQEEIHGIWGASILSDPKRIEWLADGTVRVREHVPENVTRQSLFDSDREALVDWVSHGGAWTSDALGQIHAPGAATDAYWLHTRWGRDLALAAEIKLEADSVASLLVRANPSAMAGYCISLDGSRGVVRLERLFPAEPATLLQERPVALTPGRWHQLKVVVQGEFFDVYVDETLLLVRHERTYGEGCFGLHARGAVQMRHVRADRYVGAEAIPPDWEHHCQPYHLFPARTT